MSFGKPKFNFKQSLKLALVSTGAFLCLTPSVKAFELPGNNSRVYDYGNPIETTRFQHPRAVTIPASRPIEVAYDYDACPRNTYLFRYAETRNYYVWICATEGGNLYYVAQGKNPNRGGITLRIRSYSDTRFVAFNGNTRYIVTPSRLVVTQDSRTILNERILQWEEGTGLQG